MCDHDNPDSYIFANVDIIISAFHGACRSAIERQTWCTPASSKRRFPKSSVEWEHGGMQAAIGQR
jgi:hypothetical protein